MFRLLLRSLAINFAAVYIAFKILSGVVTYPGGFHTLVLVAIAVALGNLVVRPIINLLLLPIHLVTLGLFRWLVNLLILFAVIRFIPGIGIHAFTFPGLDLQYLLIPRLHFSAFGAFVVTTLVMATTFHLLYWLLQD